MICTNKEGPKHLSRKCYFDQIKSTQLVATVKYAAKKGPRSAAVVSV